MIRANVYEAMKTTMSRFLIGLNPDIRIIVEFHEHVEIEDLVHQETKMEHYLKRKSVTKRHTSGSSNPNWKGKGKQEFTLGWKKDNGSSQTKAETKPMPQIENKKQ